jgi:hypothetical protein
MFLDLRSFGDVFMHRDCWFFGPSGQVDRGFDSDRNSSGRLLEKVEAGGIGDGILLCREIHNEYRIYYQYLSKCQEIF